MLRYSGLNHMIRQQITVVSLAVNFDWLRVVFFCLTSRWKFHVKQTQFEQNRKTEQFNYMHYIHMCACSPVKWTHTCETLLLIKYIFILCLLIVFGIITLFCILFSLYLSPTHTHTHTLPVSLSLFHSLYISYNFISLSLFVNFFPFFLSFSALFLLFIHFIQFGCLLPLSKQLKTISTTGCSYRLLCFAYATVAHAHASANSSNSTSDLIFRGG